MKKFIYKFFDSLPAPAFTRMRDCQLFSWMNQNAVGRKVLNLGSGSGQFDGYLEPGVKMVNLDIVPGPGKVDIVGDAQALPFKNGALDIVYSIAVLEHVARPWLAAAEISRVLRSGGWVVLELPLLNVIHDESDYFRFTDKGIRALFPETEYEVIYQGVGSGGGSFLSVFLHTYLKQFVPTRTGKALWHYLMRYPLSWLKYLDVLVGKSPEQRLTANSFSFIGRKR